jgi:hypothetical protein
MSSGIAPVPTASAATVSDRQPHAHSQDGGSGEQQAEPAPESAKGAEPGTVVHLHPEPPANNAAATFAASQLAERLRLVEANLRLLKLKTEGWKPPASELSLRDKTI